MKTTKKQKFVGYKTLIDPDTGEAYPMQMNVLEDRDFNFTKVWMQHLVNSLDSISNQKLRLAFWIIDNLNKENQLIMTQRAIAEANGMSTQTVNKTIKALCETPEGGYAFLQKINSGAYRVNPDVLFKGSHSNRMGICYEYREVQQEQKPKNQPKSKKNPDSEQIEVPEQMKLDEIEMLGLTGTEG
uniref:Plasmid replication protein RepL domain-containing protein n=1 Tax=uncultured prokaryote TaxID=198431 RepID=A0A0H5QKL5_9ZZZZ|nr:hypothetical protein [uncultured prokaryote]